MRPILRVMPNPEVATTEHWVHPKGFWPGWLCAWPSRDWRTMQSAFLGEMPGQHTFYSETQSVAPGAVAKLAVVRIAEGVVQAQFRALWNISLEKLKADESDFVGITQKRAIREWISENSPVYCPGGMAISAQVDFDKTARDVDGESFSDIMMELGQIDAALQSIHQLKTSELEALCESFGYSMADLLYPGEG